MIVDVADFVLEEGKKGGEGLRTVVHQMKEFVNGCGESFGVS